MFIVDDNKLTAVCLPGGLVAWLNTAEFRLAKSRVGNSRTMADVVLVMREEQAKSDPERRWLAVRMAVNGEFSALRREFDLWGVEPTE